MCSHSPTRRRSRAHAHRRAVAVPACHADVACPLGLQVAAEGPVIRAVGELRVGPLHATVALEAGHLLRVAELLGAHRGRPLAHRAPRGHGIRAPLGGQRGERVGAEHVGRELVADLHRSEQPLLVAEVLDLLDESALALVERPPFVFLPFFFARFDEQLLLLGLAPVRIDVDCRCCDSLTPLVDVERVAALETGGSGEAGVAPCSRTACDGTRDGRRDRCAARRTTTRPRRR